jgi:hypothetical protein
MKFVSHHVQGNAAMASSIPTALKALAAVSLLPLLAARCVPGSGDLGDREAGTPGAGAAGRVPDR